MTNLEWKESKVKEGTFEASLTVKLVSEPSEKTLTNSNGKNYKVCTIELENGVKTSAIIYEGNYTHGVEVNNSYTAKAIFDPSRGDEVLIQMSHLTPFEETERLKATDLGFSKPGVSEKAIVEETVEAF